MRVHVLQHVPFEDIGSMAAWCAEHDAKVTHTRFFESTDLPDLASIDLLIVMGGPMSVNDEDQFPWFKMEKRFIRDAVDRGVAVVGLCLGSQLIASALGSCVYSNDQKEIGWFPVEAVSSNEDVFRFPETTTVFQWHGETFDLPPQAVHIAKSPACTHQAFQVGSNVLALQFHLETQPETVEDMIEHCGGELVEGAYIQTAEEMRATPDEVYKTVNKLMGDVLSYVTRRDH